MLKEEILGRGKVVREGQRVWPICQLVSKMDRVGLRSFFALLEKNQFFV